MSEAPQEEAAKSRAASPPSGEVAPPLISNAKGMYTHNLTYQLYVNVNSAYRPLHDAFLLSHLRGVAQDEIIISFEVRSLLGPWH